MSRAANKRDLAGESVTQLEALLAREGKRCALAGAPARALSRSNSPAMRYIVLQVSKSTETLGIGRAEEAGGPLCVRCAHRAGG